MNHNTNALEKIKKFGGFMSGMVMPNLGAFVGWGLLAALFIENGWFPNEQLNEMVTPMLNYLLPILIGYTAGYNIHGQRGGVIGAFATMGVIVGSEVTMFSGAMLMGPISAWLLKKIDKQFEGKVKPGFEMFVDNFTLGILGLVLAIAGYFVIGPVVNAIIVVLSAGVNFMINKGLIPLLSVFVAPAQVLFLNNAINHGIVSPLAYAQAQQLGKSMLFLLDSNCGPSLGVLLAISLFGKGKAKKTAPMAMFIAGIAGIGEVYFPFVLANPIMILGTMAGQAVSYFLLVVLNGGLVAMPSPGSLINIALMTPKDAAFGNFVAILAGFVVAFIVDAFILKLVGAPNEEDINDDVIAHVIGSENGKLVQLNNVIFACDAGMGSSAMGSSILKKKLAAVGLTPNIQHVSVTEIPEYADLVVTNKNLAVRAKDSTKGNIPILTLENFMDQTEYDNIVSQIQDMIHKDKADSVSDRQLQLPILAENNIVLHASFKNKIQAIEQCADIFIENGYTDISYKKDMLQRDKEASVYLGNGVALPHGLASSKQTIKHSGICFIQVPEGVDFDGKTVYFIIGVAGKNDEHVEILGKIAELLMERENIDKLKNAKTKQEVLDILNI